ncbi:MAG: HAMP domain-containing histidine kinase, partial [Clostridia bacterium]|nr:HAMP domain-containing histidine kinase [Clostridia bacterium]
MKNKIAQRLTQYFALALILFAVIAGTLFSLMFARHTADVTRRDLHAHASSIAQTIAQFTADCDQGECKGSGFKAYMRYIGDAAMSDLYLLDQDGNSVVLGELKTPQTPPPQDALPLVRTVFETGEATQSAFTLNPFQLGEMMVCAPVSDAQGCVQFALVMQAGVHGITHALLDTFYMFTACLCIAMVLAIAVSVFLSRRFVTPLHLLMDATTRMAGGDYTAKTHVTQNDEIGTLAAQIDDLALKLDEAQKEHLRFDQMRQDFFSDISHELRTPISVLKGNIELLGITQDPERRQQCHAQLSADVNHLQRLVNDLLEFNRLQNAQFVIEKDVINLMDVLSDTVRSMRGKAAEKQITIRMDPAQPFAILGDYGRLRQMMIILLDNAIKFSEENSDVTIAIRRTGSLCEVSVIDQGCGFDEDTPIFDRYYHQNSGRNTGGTGLGLPIAREIALRHNARLTCHSKPKEGSCFTVAFCEHHLPEDA